MTRHTYRLEYKAPGGPWRLLDADVRKTWAEGWLAHHRNQPGPRLAQRLIRSDGKVIETVEGLPDAGLGMVAGFPDARQYASAALRALREGSEVARRAARREAQHGRNTPEARWAGPLSRLAAALEKLLEGRAHPPPGAGPVTQPPADPTYSWFASQDGRHGGVATGYAATLPEAIAAVEAWYSSRQP
jgi:hypothetical protein